MIEPQIQTNPALDEPLTTPEEIALTEDPQSMLGEDMKNLQAKLLEEQPEQQVSEQYASVGGFVSKQLNKAAKYLGREVTDVIEPPAQNLKSWATGVVKNREVLKQTPKVEQKVKPAGSMVQRVPIGTQTTTVTRTPQQTFTSGQSVKLGQNDIDLEALNLASSTLSDFDDANKWQINFDTINTDDDVKAVIAHISETNKSFITDEQRDVIHDFQLKELARDLQSEPEFIEKIMTREAGGDIPTAESVLAMRQVLEASGKKLRELSMKVADPLTVTPEDKIAFARQYEFHSKFQAKFMGVRSEFGRGLRAFGVPTEEMDIANVMAHIDSNLDITTMANMINNADSLRGINQQVNAFNTMWKDGSNFIYSTYMGSMLSGLGTQAVVLAGSVANMASRVGERVFAPLFYSGGQKIDTIESGEASAMLFAYQGAFLDGWKAMWKTFTTGEAYKSIGSFGEVYPDKKPSEAFNLSGGGGWLLDKAYGGLTFMMRNVMGGMDSFFTVINERAQYSALAYRKAHQMLKAGIIQPDQFQTTLKGFFDNPPEDMLAEASNFALEIGMREPTGKAVNDFKRAVNSTPFGRYIVPFINTMANQIDQTIMQRTPAAVFSQKFQNDILAGGAKAQLAMTKMSLGTGVLFTMFNIADEGKITGPVPSDKATRDAWKEAGIQPYSFVFEEDGQKKYISYQSLEPFATLFGIAASLSDYTRRTERVDLTRDEEAQYNSLMANVLYAVSENVLNKTFATGIETFFEAFQSPKAMEQLVQNYTNTMIPYAGLRRNISKNLDDVKRDTDNIYDYIKVQLPFLYNSENLPAKRDIFGEEIKWTYKNVRYETVMGTDDPVRLEIVRLNEATGRTAAIEFRDMFNSAQAEPKDREKWLVYARKDRVDSMGRNLHDVIYDTMQTDVYMDSIEFEKVNIIRGIFQDWDRKALRELEKEDPDLHEKLVGKKAGIRAQYLYEKEKMSKEQAIQQAQEEFGYGNEY